MRTSSTRAPCDGTDHGFAAVFNREAQLHGAPASDGETAFRGAAGFREAPRRRAVLPSRNAVLDRRAGPRYRAARRAVMRSAHCEIRPGENVTLQYLSHDGRPARRTSRSHRTFANGKIPAARPSRYSVEFRLVREENGNALPGDRARRSRPGARQPLGRTRVPETGHRLVTPSTLRSASAASTQVREQFRRNDDFDVHPLSSHLAKTAALWRGLADQLAQWFYKSLSTGRVSGLKLAFIDLATEATRRAARRTLGNALQKPIPPTCAECGKALPKQRREFCSRECRRLYNRGEVGPVNLAFPTRVPN
jgi:hypothetical protein